MSTLFIADLHLDPARPEIIATFERFLGREAASAEALYILGDLFEAWIGDDDDDPQVRAVLAALRRLTVQGVPVLVVHGNRDFLMGSVFEAATGCRLLPEASVIDLYGEPVLIMHGDTLCTADTAYLAFRTQMRNPAVQQGLLAKPLAERRAMAAHLRMESQAANQAKAEAIMDVTPEEVARVMSEHGVRRLIHGHTHRPGFYPVPALGADAERIVLGDWYEQGSVLICDPHGCRLETLPSALPA